ncbi:hypothetical protein Poli38472_012071 [Pythium oligandrum]|uniref:cDENN domain-containing protein n=1 Tax=Pythium oligandrum TaxID=41045 RepID=A0A8K1CP71_PYTOL|nr:hypothetical protein Poli38472_012071 [Pythium oligandrum]|eukprot:TMW66955.1 hypothetical protein Poli38472_012071 [Pythium oligandrum]
MQHMRATSGDKKVMPLRRASLSVTTSSAHSPNVRPTLTSAFTHSLPAMHMSSGKRPRTSSAQGDFGRQSHTQPSSPVVVGISAASGDDVEDWSEDFVEHTPRSHTVDGRMALGRSERGSDGDLMPRTLRSFQRTSGFMHRASIGRRSWHSQKSLERYTENERNSRIRRSTNDGGRDDGDVPVLAGPPRESVGVALASASPLLPRNNPDMSSRWLDDDDDSRPPDLSNISGPRRKSVESTPEIDESVQDDEDDEDEDWDAEFGFADDDEQDGPKISGGIDTARRRSDNFNIFLRGFHDMMVGDDLLDDEEELTKSRKARKSVEEQLFQRRRSEMHAPPSIDGSADGVLRSSLSSLPGTTEYTLIDKYRLVDVACTSTYSVRIERYPKPCTTYSQLERDAAVFPMITDNKLEQWLENVVRPKCAIVNDLMSEEQANTPNPRQQKNHQFRTLVSLPFGTKFVDRCFKQIAVYRFCGEDKSNRELVRVFFEKLATAGIAGDKWSSKLPMGEFNHVAESVMEVLQEAARLYGPVSSAGVVTKSTATSKNGGAAFWTRQFQTILTICFDAFPTYRHMISLIELRFVCHHLVGFANGDLNYTWQMCDKYLTFSANEAIAGQSAPILANEILQYYGALLVAIKQEIAANSNPFSFQPNLPARFCIPRDMRSLFALALCDIQSVYDSRSALAETTIPELIELFEFEDEDVFYHDQINCSCGKDDMTSRDSSDDYQSIVALLKPGSFARRHELEAHLYRGINVTEQPLIKAKCAHMLSSMAVATASMGSTSSSHLKSAESLGFEALRLLEFVSTRKLEELGVDETGHREQFSSMFSSDGLLSALGKEVLENLGNILVKNHKYRFGILCFEAATAVFSLVNQGKQYERLDRVMCTLTTQADDVKRAIPLHEKVAASCLRQGNVNEYVFLTQVLVNLWVREGKFSRAEDYLSSAFQFLRDQTSLLPPFFLSAQAGTFSGSEVASTSSRSGTMLTTSSTASSSLSGSFVISGRGNTSEMDSWLNHDINLHLLVRDIYRASGRLIEGMRVLEYVLTYSGRLPRGKRTYLRMLLAEDALKLRVFDTTRCMFHLLDQEANFFCDRILQSTIGAGLGSSSGGFGSSGGGGSSSGGRSLGGMGSEARFCFDMVLSIRYILGRTKLYLHLGELHHAYAWLSLAHIKNERESVRNQAKLHWLDGRVLFELLQRQQEQRLMSDKQTHQKPAISVEDMLQSFSASLYALNKSERERFIKRMTDFRDSYESAEKTLELGVQAYWSAYDHYQALDDGHHQLKALLGVIQLYLTPVERSFFILGNTANDEKLMAVLDSCAVIKGSGETDAQGGNDAIEKVRKTLLETQSLLRRALSLAEQIAEPGSYFRTLVFCSQAWTWLERLAPYKSEKPIKEGAAFWEEAVKVLKAVFLRRVAFDQRTLDGMGVPSRRSTFSLVPILNFREGSILRLEAATLQLISVACQLQQFDRVPEYVEEMVTAHIDELLSARLCLNGIAHQLRLFRAQQQQSLARQIPLHSIPGPSGVGSHRSSTDSSSRPSLTASSGPGLPTGGSTGSLLVNASGTKRKGHKKNQSMSSISELLTSSGSGSGVASSSFHDLSASFLSANGRHTFLGGSATPRTGLASLSDRSKPGAPKSVSNNSSVGHAPYGSSTKSPSNESVDSSRSRHRSRSAPQPLTPVNRAGGFDDGLMHKPDLSPVNEVSRSRSNVRIVELKDVRLDNGIGFSRSTLAFHDAFTNDGGSSTGGVGIYDFDDVQSERLWWIFNSWRESKVSYVSGKTDISAFRHQNMKTLRLLLDSFDPQQVAVLNSGALTKTGGAGGMLGFDVAHINMHALVEDGGHVLMIGYNGPRSSLTPSGHSRLEYKVFKVSPYKTSTWRREIPRPEWYLSRQAVFDAEFGSMDSAVLRLLRLLGVKVVLKLVGAILLENPLVVVGSSFPQIKEVMLCFLQLLQPFRWQHTFLPFLPVTSWRFLANSLHHYVKSQIAGRSKSKMSLGISWNSPRGSSTPSTSLDEDEPPFLIGTTLDTWQTCLQRLRTSSVDERSIPNYVNVLDLDNPSTFVAAKSNSNAISFPRKWRKQLMEKFEKVVKQRRKMQERMTRRRFDRQSSVSSSISAVSAESPASASYSRSQNSFVEKATALAPQPTRTPTVHTDDRAYYDTECAAAFVSGLHDFYDRLYVLSAERAKKLKGKAKKKHSKRQEIKSWFSSSHDFDAYVSQFVETTIFDKYDQDQQQPPTISGLLSAAHFPAIGARHPASGIPISGLARSFGSVSSSSSNFMGAATSSHYQL